MKKYQTGSREPSSYIEYHRTEFTRLEGTTKTNSKGRKVFKRLMAKILIIFTHSKISKMLHKAQ